MRSFHLDPDSRNELVPFAVTMVIAAATFAGLSAFDAVAVGIRIGVIVIAAVLVGQFGGEFVRRSLAQQYPNAKWIGLLSTAYALMGFGVVGQFVFDWITPPRLFYLFLLPAGVAILVFLVRNRRDRDVME